MKADHIDERLDESDRQLREVADVILQLRANAERLEDVLEVLEKEENGRAKK